MSYDILLDSPRLVLTCWRKTLKTLAQSVLLVLVSLGHLLPWPMRGLNHDFFEHLYRDCSNKLLSVNARNSGKLHTSVCGQGITYMYNTNFKMVMAAILDSGFRMIPHSSITIPV